MRVSLFRFLICFCALSSISLTSSRSFGQATAPASSSTSIPMLPSSSNEMERSPMINNEAMIFSGSVDPKEYHMGPGDMLQLRIWTASEPHTLLVSSEEDLIVPRIGEFNVKGKTLQNIEDSIKARALNVFRSGKERITENPVSVTL